MPAKAPIYLKSTNSKKGKKCRLRDILSPDMISPPLGDFRHTIHIGKGGERDAFGDMSFLQGKFELLPGKGRGVPSQYASTMNFCGPTAMPISLPSIGGCQALTLPLLSTNVFSMPVMDPLDLATMASLPMAMSNADWVDRDSGVDEGRICDFDFEFSKDKSESHDSISNITGSLLSLELDLGPSILDDQLSQIKQREGQFIMEGNEYLVSLCIWKLNIHQTEV
uniref:CRIB domain-containing protein n=1 Tax=Esox lucius TaxID=8010 RepID=A0AAY5L710_ESOLU